MNDNEYLDYIFKDHKNPTPYSIKLFGVSVLSFYYHNRFGWFRLFGKGLTWKDTSIHSLLFSERYGNSKGINVYKWRISFLSK